MKWNESGFRPPLCTYRLNLARRTFLRMVIWMRWHCPPDTGFEIRALAVWGRARYLSVTEAPHNTKFNTWMENKHFGFFQTAETGNRTPNSSVKGSGASHYPRAPVHQRGEIPTLMFYGLTVSASGPTSDIRFWRLCTSAPKEWNTDNDRRPIT